MSDHLILVRKHLLRTLIPVTKKHSAMQNRLFLIEIFRPSVLWIFCIVLLLPSLATAQLTDLQTVVVTGGEFLEVSSPPEISSDGYVMLNLGISDGRGVYLWKEGTLTPVARKGDSGSVGLFDSVAANSLRKGGRIALGVNVKKDLSNDRDSYLFNYQSGAFNLVWSNTGPAVPGIGGDSKFISGGPLSVELIMDGDGRFIVEGGISGFESGIDNTNNAGIWKLPEGPDSLVMRRGMPKPSPGVGTFGVVSRFLAVSNNSKIAFYEEGIWLADQGLVLAAYIGQPAPGTNTTFYEFDAFISLNNQAEICFVGHIEAHESLPRLDGIWKGTAGNLELVALQGGRISENDPRSLSYGAFGKQPVINDKGMVAFGATADNGRKVIVKIIDGEGFIVAEVDQPPPGINDFRAVFKEIGPQLSFNRAGRVAFLGKYEAESVDPTTGIWAENADGLQLIVKVGDVIQVAEDDLRTVTELQFINERLQVSSGNADGYKSGFSDRGELLFFAKFLDGTAGVFVKALEVLNGTGFFWREGIASGNWSEVNNWEDSIGDDKERAPGINPPENASDEVVIQNADVTVDIDAQVGTLLAGGDMHIVSGAGLILGSEGNASDPFEFTNGDMDNRGTILQEAGLQVVLDDYDIVNFKNYTLKDGSVSGQNGSSFHNRGKLLKEGAGEQEISVPFENELDGVMEVNQGSLKLSGETVVFQGIQLDKSLQIASDSEVLVTGPLTMRGDFNLHGLGILRISSPWTVAFGTSLMNIEPGTGVRVVMEEGASLDTEDGKLVNNSVLEWLGGEISGGVVESSGVIEERPNWKVINGLTNKGEMAVPSGAVSPVLTGAILNEGEIILDSDLIINGGTIVNRSNETLQILGVKILNGDHRGKIINDTGKIVSRGTFLESNLIESHLQMKNGDIVLESGLLALNGGGYFTGVNEIQFNGTTTLEVGNNSELTINGLSEIYKHGLLDLLLLSDGDTNGGTFIVRKGSKLSVLSGLEIFSQIGGESDQGGEGFWLDGGEVDVGFSLRGLVTREKFLWTAGVLNSILGKGRVEVVGTLKIEDGAEKLLRAVLRLSDFGKVIQTSDLFIDGGKIVIDAKATWEADDDIQVSEMGGRIENFGNMTLGTATSSSPPMIVVEADVDNQKNIIVNSGLGEIGSDVEITGKISQLDGDILTKGEWRIGKPGSFKMSSIGIIDLGPDAYVELKGQWKNFFVEENRGKFHLWTTHEVSKFSNWSNAIMHIYEGGHLKVTASNLVQNGSLTVDSGAKVEVNGAISHTSGNTIIHGDLTASNYRVEGGRVSGSGVMHTEVEALHKTGPGASAGKLTVDGSFKQFSTGSLEIELGGNEAGSLYDQLVVNGTATLDGELRLLLIEDFENAVTSGDTFDILTATSIVGEFSNAPNGARIPTSGGKGSFVVNYSSDKVTVTAFEPAEQGEASIAVISRFLLNNESQALSFNVAGSIGHKYGVETSTNMTDWDLLHSELIDFDESFDYEYLLGEDEDRRFFRVGPAAD